MYGRGPVVRMTESLLSGAVPSSRGDLAQLARASALQAEGQGFKSPNLQYKQIFDITREGTERNENEGKSWNLRGRRSLEEKESGSGEERTR